MEYTLLGKEDLRVSRLGFGCCPMGGHGWGHTEENELIEAVHVALDSGVNLFDTADIYGLGVSEMVLGKALGSRRRDSVIASKFGLKRSADGKTCYDNSPKWIVTALEGSLRRLNTDYIDIYQVHYWDEVTPLLEVFDTLEKARLDGKIRYYGVTNIDLADMGYKDLPSGLACFSFEYSLANRRFEGQIERFMEDYLLGFLAWGSLGQGILCGRYDQATVFSDADRRSHPRYVNFHGTVLQKNVKIVKAMKNLMKSYPTRTLPQIAIRWILDYLQTGVVLVGSKRPAQIQENIRAFGWSLHGRDINLLDEISKE